MITREAAAMADLPCRRRHRNYHAITKPVSTLIMTLAALTGIVTVAGDPASDKVVLESFKAGISNSDILGWTASDPCAWNDSQVKCDNDGNVVQLRVRDLTLAGTVTPDLHKLTSLTFLELNFNAFTGAMPTLAGMAKLEIAFLDNNGFDSIPADFFDGLVSIKEIFIEKNPLNKSTGGWPMPLSMKDAAATLEVLGMDNCGATGVVPSYLGDMPLLKTFNGAYNSFSGGIPDSFSKSGISVLLLNNQAGGGLSGGIASIGGMVGLTELSLHQNKFTGPVPEGIASAAGLSLLRLSENLLVGRLPLALGSLKAFKADSVWIAGNFFSGEQPEFPPGSVNAEPGLENTFCGEPGEKCSAKVDALLDFLAAAGYPQATATTWVGADPCADAWSRVSCDAATGEVVSIMLAKSELEGTISPSLAKLPSLETINLSGNRLREAIPTELTQLTWLKLVDVSDNNLSGPLPSFPSSVEFIYSGNPLLAATPPPALPPPVTPPVLPPPANPPTIPPTTPPTIPPAPPPTIPPAPPPTIPPATPPTIPPATPPTIPPTTPPTIPPTVPPTTPPTLPPAIPPTIPPTTPPAPAPAIAPPVSGPAPVGNNPPTTAPAPASIAPGGPSPTPGILPPASSPAPTVPTPSNPKTSIVGPVVGAVVGATVLGALGFWFICFYYQKKSRKRNVPTENQHVHPEVLPSTGTAAAPEFVKIVVDSGSPNGSYHPDGQAPEAWNMAFTIDQLRSVTSNFAERNVLGRGGFGVVYKGILADGTKIAVKRMEAAVVSSKGLREFQSEIAVLTKVKHRHLVGLLGYCTDGIERLLVYEYMSQGTLAQHLFKYEEMTGKPLTWTTRLVIALDVAQGVEYLHSLAHRSFIHRDLKPSNVLLNDDFRAKVSDFGLVKLAPEGNFHSVETRLAGTFGYLAPEYAVTGRVTTKADVFSFGVILMELLTGRRAVDETQSEEDMYLVTWFTQKMRSKQEALFRSTIDPTIGDIDDETTFKSITTVAELACHCTAREPAQRPDMGYVVSVLRPLVDEWKPMEMDFDVDVSSRDTDMSLTKALKQWQEFKDESTTSSTVTTDNSVNSLPARLAGFAESFASADGR